MPEENARRIKVHFNADRSEQLPWKFVPQQKFVSVLPGESSLAFYRAENTSNEDIIGIATYNVTPDRVRSIPPSRLLQRKLIAFRTRLLLIFPK